ncbi:helix-turn-helix domain-containing protein [Hymenobacter crusticola]|uniref:AraC family transcriptional regulator n=1 Tax=Hymenobacter crusticola TaxID=1770526 RepID=A0A243W9Z8_9BACT|nr:AraC family transcriptional regulator [Hymenobacter crusticola]OUJ72373.1 AraC family transcriptional regulator [Hymenobacter crusticola]
MANTTDPHVPQLVYSCVSKRVVEGELFIRQHVVDYIIAGTSEVSFGGQSHLFQAGDFRFAARNRLSKFVKQPPQGGEYRSLSICIDQTTLLELKSQFQSDGADAAAYDNVFVLKPNPLFNNYIDSLLPYVEHNHQLEASLVRVKVKEAVLIFLAANPHLKALLFDFNEPGKIDLQAYMEEHYHCNSTLEHFAYLTGRSLSTFKRDFGKLYHTTPSRWLVQKRLEDAHYLLKEKKRKSTEVYLEVGFKDYAHFFVAFKKHFGIAPSMMQ